MKALSTLCFAACALLPLQAAVERPNIILINADDLGYGDLSCYGSKVISTPRLDRLAQEGVRFTDFYVASPFCSPSRAALLTGRLPARCGVPYVLFPTEHTGLPPEEVTLAEMLKPAGYATALIGKWHLGWRRELRPQQQGFDEVFGLRHSNDSEEWTAGKAFFQLSDFEPLTLRDGDRIVEAPVDQALLTEKYTQRALDFIRRQREKPFFLYLPHTMPHIPQYASPVFEGTSKDGVYGDCIQELDASTGRIVDLLAELGIAEKTLVLFTSDNGASMGKKGVAKGKAKAKAERFPGRSNGGSNEPLKMGKGTTWEGGVRVPFIAWWPKTIPAGRVETAPCSTLDFFPTLAALAGVKPDPAVKLDGMDISALLKGEAKGKAQDRLIPHYFGVQLQAVREGEWKLILPVSKLPEMRVASLWFEHQPGLFERQHRLWPEAALYNLTADPGEQVDVAAKHPEIVARLLKKAQEFDQSFQPHIHPVLRLPGPLPPKPGQVSGSNEDLAEWKSLAE
ncbi:sulfatase [Prosthecobacter sp. SYSU 5D2]|uniref:sulfatase family protein n=1 Tax=Prosthecobacter sp. SYSU 5D2 TaxID=3134134 RepID=UPI0031FEEDFC